MSRSRLAAVLLLAACAAPARELQTAAPPTAPREPMSDPAEYAIEHVSEAAGEIVFARTGVGDPYRTGIPYPIFLALLAAYPDELGGDPARFAARFGLVARAPRADSDDRDEREGLPLGMHLTTDPNTRIQFLVTNCALCHVETVRWPGGEARVVGLGNRRIRIHAYDDALARIAARPDFDRAHLAPAAARIAGERHLGWSPDYRDAVLEATLRALRERPAWRGKFLARVRDGLPGRVATIEAFAVALGHELHREVATGASVGWAKIPDVIGFAAKRTLSWDGGSEGSSDALIVDADLAAGARVEWLWKHPFQGPSLAAYLRHLPRELRFPAPIDAELARRGKMSFEKNCAKCHGSYHEDGRVKQYVEKIVPEMVLETDPARTEAVTDDFVAAANDPKLDGGVHLIRTRRTSGYVPPVLTNIWARAPYGHAGQWPSLAVLAMRPESRPRRVVIHGDAPLDLARVGMATGEDVGELAAGDYLLDGTAPGFHTGGHPFLADLDAADQRAVIEYLKTL